MNDEIVFDTITEHYQRWLRRDDPITDLQRSTLLLLQELTGISVDIDSLVYGTAGEVILHLSKQLKYHR
jgi:hypothetical protein